MDGIHPSRRSTAVIKSKGFVQIAMEASAVPFPQGSVVSSEERWFPKQSIMPDSWKSGPSRDLTAVSVEGPIGASSTVYETNWKCPDCGSENLPRRTRWSVNFKDVSSHSVSQLLPKKKKNSFHQHALLHTAIAVAARSRRP